MAVASAPAESRTRLARRPRSNSTLVERWHFVNTILKLFQVDIANLSTLLRSAVVSTLFILIKTCYLCEEHGRESRTASGACMQCNKPGCRQSFHVTW